MFNYHNKKFCAVSNTPNSETSAQTIFHYRQEGNIVTAHYAGGSVVAGHLIGIVDEKGVIDMRYHQVNVRGELMTGVCRSVPELMDNGKIRLYETWQWTSGDESKGQSIIQEL
jgi:dihydrodipicolinate reductase